MIFRLLIWSGPLLVAGSLLAAPLHVDFLRAGSKTYSNVTIIGANTTDLYFTHNQGISNVKLKYVDESLRQRFQYDPRLAAEAEKQQTEDDRAYQGTLASKLVADAQKAARAARNAAATSEDSLADPLSDASLLGKQAPGLEVDRWLGPKPVLKGKVGLIVFWAPWSIPCRKAIADFNALQRQFADRLVVVGISSESQEETEAAEPKLEFASGIDSKGHLSAAAGVTSVPCVLLVDTKGVVRYQGHPSAIDAKKLEGLLAKE